MADTPVPVLSFPLPPGCPDCGRRETTLPRPLPDAGLGYDWSARDYDSIRLFMLDWVAARFPDRPRWTAGELEVVLVELFAAVLDELSDQIDRVAAESWLETARRPESVIRLLRMIGYDPLREGPWAALAGLDPADGLAEREAALALRWYAKPLEMESARATGPTTVRVNQRAVTVEDYGTELAKHPLVRRARASVAWTGSWNTVRVAAVLWDERRLDQSLGDIGPGHPAIPPVLQDAIRAFHAERAVPPPPPDIAATTGRAVLTPFVEAWRMAGQDVELRDPVFVGIVLLISAQVLPSYYRSEVEAALDAALGQGPGGFFEPGRLDFGEDVYLSDLVEWLMAVPGVDNLCVNRFKRVGKQNPDEVASERIVLSGLEVAVCDDDPAHPERGYRRLTLHGGIAG